MSFTPAEESKAIENIRAIVGVGPCVAVCAVEIGSNGNAIDHVAVMAAAGRTADRILCDLMSAEIPCSIAADDENKILIPFNAAVHPPEPFDFAASY